MTNHLISICAYECFYDGNLYSFYNYTFFKYGRDIESQIRAFILTYLSISAVVTLFQLIFPEVLITSVGITVLILGIYLNLEEPAIKG